MQAQHPLVPMHCLNRNRIYPHFLVLSLLIHAISSANSFGQPAKQPATKPEATSPDDESGADGVSALSVEAGATTSGTSESSANSGRERSLAEIRESGILHSNYRRQQFQPSEANEVPKPQLDLYKTKIQPILERSCFDCHGPDLQEGNIRIDTLDPNLTQGEDVAWWLEVFAVLSNGEMPPADDVEMSDQDRALVADWLATELHTASRIRRAQHSESAFRRMTKYEYNYVLQDLLGLPFDFAKDLPPEAVSEGGFQNSAETLHMSAIQFATYQSLARAALKRATVQGKQPEPLHWTVTMRQASEGEWAKQDAEAQKIRDTHKDDPEKLEKELDRFEKRSKSPHGRAYYRDASGRTAVTRWSYHGAKFAWKPSKEPSATPPVSEDVAILPPRQKLIVELGDRIPERGTLRVRVRASRLSEGEDAIPSLQLEFGWQASNDSHASVRVSKFDRRIDAVPGDPKTYQWDIPISDVYPRNLVRNTNKLGDLPSPSEYIRFVNSSVSRGDIQIDLVEVISPVYASWPPKSHQNIFIPNEHGSNELAYARDVLSNFLPKAWRRTITDAELERKLALFTTIRDQCDSFEDAMIEVLATALSSPKFLYLSNDRPSSADSNDDDFDLATKMAIMLWNSTPDTRLLELASQRRLRDPSVLDREIDRMLADERSSRFSQHFVEQWLGMQLLEYLKVDRKEYPGFDPSLQEAMRREPVLFFHEILRHNRSVLDFLHADYVIVNERLAQHYGLPGVFGNDFRRVNLPPEHRRGGLLTQAGLLAMNSDGKDSHPLKRGIWLLENLLNDPPPPPPPAVPQIDLADPEIAKLSLKERMADHRNQAACRSCHLKIDPWGIALENFDAIGGFRTHVRGKPADATSELFNRQTINGVDGLKRFLLQNRQDQFARALVEKLTTYAIGRPLSFADRAEVERITSELRKQDDGLQTLIKLIIRSELFHPQFSPSVAKSD